jgi:hypothetical protein
MPPEGDGMKLVEVIHVSRDDGAEELLEIHHEGAGVYVLSGTAPPRFIKRGALVRLRAFVETSGLFEVIEAQD